MRPFKEAQRSPKGDQGSLRVTRRSQRWKAKRQTLEIYTNSCKEVGDFDFLTFS
jgi:hypothetical protein